LQHKLPRHTKQGFHKNFLLYAYRKYRTCYYLSLSFIY